MKTLGPRYKEAITLALVLACAAAIGGWLLFHDTGIIGPEEGINPADYSMSLGVALNQGYREVYSIWDEKDSFLKQEIPSLDPAAMPANVHFESPNFNYFRCHRYLFSFVGLIWRWFGISWTTFKIAHFIVFLATAAVAYGLCRLAMGRAVSALVSLAFLASPGVLIVAPSLRDFAKAPFLLGVMLMLGVLIRYRIRRRTYLLLALAMGAVLGIGLGFRQDMNICIPLCLLFLVVVARGEKRIGVLMRGAGVSIFLFVFVALGAPILWAMAGEGGAVAAHSLAQGLSRHSYEMVGLADSPYELSLSPNDNEIQATVNSYARRSGDMTRMEFFHCKPYAQAGRNYFREVCRMFPADIIARGYGAIIATLKSPHEIFESTSSLKNAQKPMVLAARKYMYPFTAHVADFGLVYALIALVIISAIDLRMAILAAFLCAYMFGYLSILYQPRHSFHVSLASFWIAGFLLQHFWAVVRNRKAAANFLASPAQWRPHALRATTFAALLALGVFAPLMVARQWQSQNVKALAQGLHSTQLRKVETVRGPEQDGWVRQDPERRIHFMRGPVYPRRPGEETPDAAWPTDQVSIWEVPVAYLAAKFKPGEGSFPVRFVYQSSNPANNFTGVLHLGPADGGTIYFPVYEAYAPPVMLRSTLDMPNPNQWVRSRFAGIATPPEFADRFDGLYIVREAMQFPIFPYMAVGDDPAAVRTYRSLSPIIGR